jgi:hypothetical protein
MVKTISALLHLPNEVMIPVHKNHRDIVKFTTRGVLNYTTVVGHIRKCLDEITILEGM